MTQQSMFSTWNNEERQRAWKKLQDTTAAIKTTEPNKGAPVTIEYPRTTNRHMSYTNITGKRNDVYSYVAWMFSTDRVTQCYEHMALSLYQVDEHADGTITAKLSKNHYAGD